MQKSPPFFYILNLSPIALKASLALHFITPHTLVLFFIIIAVIYAVPAPIIIPATAPPIIIHLHSFFIFFNSCRKYYLLFLLFYAKTFKKTVDNGTKKRYNIQACPEMTAITRGCGLMRLDIQELQANDGTTLGFDFSLPLDKALADYVDGTASVKGTVANHGGFLLLESGVSVSAKGVCARCGELFDTSHSFTVSRPVARELNEENDEYILTDEDGFLDLEGVFSEELLLELPTKLLCREDCKG